MWYITITLRTIAEYLRMYFARRRHSLVEFPSIEVIHILPKVIIKSIR